MIKIIGTNTPKNLRNSRTYGITVTWKDTEVALIEVAQVIAEAIKTDPNLVPKAMDIAKQVNETGKTAEEIVREKANVPDTAVLAMSTNVLATPVEVRRKEPRRETAESVEAIERARALRDDLAETKLTLRNAMMQICGIPANGSHVTTINYGNWRSQ